MNFFQAIESGLRKYVDFSGRAARSEFWYFTLFVVVVGWVAAILDLVAFPALTGSPLNAAFNLAMLLPSVAISARRLHDIEQDGLVVSDSVHRGGLHPPARVVVHERHFGG